MTYTNAIYYIDCENGSDAARTQVASVPAINNGSGGVRVTKASHGLITGAIITITVGTGLTGQWKITYIDNDNFDLDGAVYSTNKTITYTPNGGSSWSDAWQTTTSGATAARIAAGDIIRFAKSPDPTSTGQNAKWTNTTFANGEPSLNIIASTNTSPVRVTVADSSYSNGDTVYITGHLLNLSINGIYEITNVDGCQFDLVSSVGIDTGGVSGTCTRITSKTIILTNPVTKTIDNFTHGWTSGGTTGNTISISSSNVSFLSNYIRVVASSSTSLGIIAKKSFSSSMDLSDYTQISFWLYFSAGSFSSPNFLKIKMYSDAAWTNEVESLTIPNTNVITSNQWTPIVINKGSALSNNVNSIAIYSDTVLSRDVYFTNLIACKNPSSSDSITHQSLISKSNLTDGGTEGWYSIDLINEKVIQLGSYCTSPIANKRGYSGTTESVPLYKKETTKTAMAASATTNINTIQDSGTFGNPIQFIGGYNTSTNEIDGETCLDGLNSFGYGFSISTKTNVSIIGFSLVRYYRAINSLSVGSNLIFEINTICACTNYGMVIGTTTERCSITIKNIISSGVVAGLYIGTSLCTFSISNIKSGSGIGITFINGCNNKVLVTSINNNLTNGISTDGGSHNNEIIVTNSNYNGSSGVSLTGNFNILNLKNSKYNGTYGIEFIGDRNKIYNCDITENGIAGISNTINTNYTRNVINSNALEFASATNYNDSRVFCTNYDGNENNHVVYTDNGLIKSDSAIRHSPYGLSWKMSVTDEIRTITYPLRFTIAKIPLQANTSTIVSAWFKKTHATSICASLFCSKLQLAGISSDIETIKSNSTDWEKLSILITPTETGVVEIEARAWYISSITESIYVDDISFT